MVHTPSLRLFVLTACVTAAAAGVSAHIIRGMNYPGFATAFLSSPSAAQDTPIPIAWPGHDTGLRVACFYVANTSPPLAGDLTWPRITAVAVELPGQRAGFTLLEPSSADWELVQNQPVVLGPQQVIADFAVLARVNPAGRTPSRPNDPAGIGPGQQATRGSGTRFCVAGPFPDGMTIEQVLNGVVVRFQGVLPHGQVIDLGVWDSPQRTIPLYP